MGSAPQHLAHLAAVAIRLARAANVHRRDAKGGEVLGNRPGGLFITVRSFVVHGDIY